MALLHKMESPLIGFGAALVTVFILLRMYGTAGAFLGRMSFETADPASIAPTISRSATTDFTLWSEKRIRAFQESLAKQFQPAVALLSIPRIHLSVPVFNGTDESVLNRGVGRILGTAHAGEAGNLGIAGHRDGFFRALKDLQDGDAVELITKRGKMAYQVDNIVIVTPDDVRILENRGIPTITLVTCYPFYFVGDAPQRYILQCSLKESNQLTGGGQNKTTGASTAK
jgi:sortase A